MGKKIKPGQLAGEVARQLRAYRDHTTGQVKEVVSDTARSVQRDIRARAPQDTGRYCRSWRVKTVRESGSGRVVVVYSPTGYRIAHLLEFGHVKRGGGRVAGRAHIKPAEEAGIVLFEQKLRQGL